MQAAAATAQPWLLSALPQGCGLCVLHDPPKPLGLPRPRLRLQVGPEFEELSGRTTSALEGGLAAAEAYMATFEDIKWVACVCHKERGCVCGWVGCVCVCGGALP